MPCYRSVESFVVGDIEGDWLCELDALGELSCIVERFAGWGLSVKGRRSVSRKWLTNSDLNARIAQNIQSGPRNETRAARMLSVWGPVFSFWSIGSLQHQDTLRSHACCCNGAESVKKKVHHHVFFCVSPTNSQDHLARRPAYCTRVVNLQQLVCRIPQYVPAGSSPIPSLDHLPIILLLLQRLPPFSLTHPCSSPKLLRRHYSPCPATNPCPGFPFPHAPVSAPLHLTCSTLSLALPRLLLAEPKLILLYTKTKFPED